MGRMRAIGLLLGMGLAWCACAQAPQEASRLATRAGGDLSAHASSYRYDEPAFALLEGVRVGASAGYTFVGPDRGVARLEAHYSYAELDYTGSGTLSGVPDYLLELRALAGADVPRAGIVWVPYIGVGLRHLYNDLRGVSSTGSAGYRRWSQYVYVPVGLQLRFSTKDGWIVTPQLEYDRLLFGRQRSYLSDTGGGFFDVTNRQRHGRGYRARLMFQGPRWSLGIWTRFWDIEDSDVQPIGGGSLGFEPANETRETGLELRLPF